LDLAMATLHAASAQVALAKSNLERCTLLAPFNGHTLKLNTEVGQWLNPGTVIAALLPSDGTEVNIPLNAQQLQLLGLPASGKCAPLKVRLRLPNQPQELDAHLIRISNELEQGTRMNQAVALLPSGIIVPPQTYLEMTILGDSIANTFSLPAVAVNGKYAQVVDSASTLHEIELTIIQQLENSYIVRGLNAGQQVSTTPVSVFVPGMQVAVINN
jgi:multidrug efflux system membrane fusion protein